MARMLFLRDLDVDVQIRCRGCGHEAVLPRPVLERRFGPNYPVLSIAPHYRCSRCDSRDTECRAAPPPEPAVAAESQSSFDDALAALHGLMAAVRAPAAEESPPPLPAWTDADEGGDSGEENGFLPPAEPDPWSVPDPMPVESPGRRFIDRELDALLNDDAGDDVPDLEPAGDPAAADEPIPRWLQDADGGIAPEDARSLFAALRAHGALIDDEDEPAGDDPLSDTLLADDEEPTEAEIAAFAIRDPDRPVWRDDPLPLPGPELEAVAEDQNEDEIPAAAAPDRPAAPGRDDDDPPPFAFRALSLKPAPDEEATQSMQKTLAALRGMVETAADGAAAPAPRPGPPAPPPPAPAAVGSLEDTLAKLRGLLELDDPDDDVRVSPPPKRR